MRPSASWQFQIFNFPVRVHVTFLLFAVLFGVAFIGFEPVRLALWILIVFFSILVHELGHAFANQMLGRSSYIEMHGMGGLTFSNKFGRTSYLQEIFVTFAGPLAGFLLAGLVFLLLRFAGPIGNSYVSFLVAQLLWVNIAWGIFNLIPILPLDGGNIMRNIVHWIRGPYDDRTPLIISIVFGVLTMIAVLVLFRSMYMLLLIGMLTLSNWQKLRQGFYTDTIY
jgi:stage IV sporulation protein FB